MGYFQVRYKSRVINYDRRVFIRLASGVNAHQHFGNGITFQKAVKAILSGPIWFHDDMKHVLREMYDTCLAFLKVRTNCYW